MNTFYLFIKSINIERNLKTKIKLLEGKIKENKEK